MPISSNDFEKSDRESNILLAEFLRSHPLDAYRVDELVEMLASKGRNLTGEEVERMLVLLEYGRKVKSKTIAGVTYYRYHEFFGFSPPTRPR